MKTQTPANITACTIGLCGFAVSAVAGLAAGADAAPTITRAIFAMLICYAVGGLLGTIGMAAVNEHLARYRTANPVPDPITPDDPPDQAALTDASRPAG